VEEGGKGAIPRQKARQQADGSYLSVGVLMVFLVPGIIILLDEAKVLLPLTLQSQLSPLHVCGEITLRQENLCQGRSSSLTANRPLKACQAACASGSIRHRDSGAGERAFTVFGFPSL